MKRYWLFAGDRFYPRGGAGDFRESLDSEELATEKARDFILADEDRWAEVLDTWQQTVMVFRYAVKWDGVKFGSVPEVIGPMQLGQSETDDIPVTAL
jgi:hypothetical protein